MDAQKSDRGTRMHILGKKDDPKGRWICDFRPLSWAATVKRQTAIGGVVSKTRALASKRRKSGLDAWSGFSQLKDTERASRLMEIIIPMGLMGGIDSILEIRIDASRSARERCWGPFLKRNQMTSIFKPFRACSLNGLARLIYVFS
jgi:hypothetical protein